MCRTKARKRTVQHKASTTQKQMQKPTQISSVKSSRRGADFTLTFSPFKKLDVQDWHPAPRKAADTMSSFSIFSLFTLSHKGYCICFSMKRPQTIFAVI